jgi:hypothetical protein
MRRGIRYLCIRQDGTFVAYFFSGMRQFLFFQSAGRDEGTVVAIYSFGGMTHITILSWL